MDVSSVSESNTSSTVDDGVASLQTPAPAPSTDAEQSFQGVEHPTPTEQESSQEDGIAAPAIPTSTSTPEQSSNGDGTVHGAKKKPPPDYENDRKATFTKSQKPGQPPQSLMDRSRALVRQLRRSQRVKDNRRKADLKRAKEAHSQGTVARTPSFEAKRKNQWFGRRKVNRETTVDANEARQRTIRNEQAANRRGYSTNPPAPTTAAPPLFSPGSHHAVPPDDANPVNVPLPPDDHANPFLNVEGIEPALVARMDSTNESFDSKDAINDEEDDEKKPRANKKK